MDKWEKYGSYEAWKSTNFGNFQAKYKAYLEKNYTPIMPDTYISFDDFCMAKWQRLD